MITKERLQKAVKGETTPKPDPKVALASKQALAVVDTLRMQFIEVQKITTPEMYQRADVLRSIVEDKIEWWDGLLEPIIRPIRQGLDATYALGRTVKRPLEKLKSDIRAAMESYKLEEVRQIREAEEAKAKLQENTETEIEHLNKQLQQAATPQLKRRLESKINTLQEKVEQVEDSSTPVEASYSTTRFGYDWELTSIREVARSVAEGKIPAEVLMVDSKFMNSYFKDHPEIVMEWPGFQVKEVVSIVKERRT